MNSKEELRILMVEDVRTDAELEIRELKRAGLHVVHRLVDTEKEFCDELSGFQPSIIISDFSMPHFDGMRALALARELAPDVPFIFVSGTIGEEYAIRALKNGATDYVLKNNLVRLPAAVERSLDDAKGNALRVRMERELRESHERFQALLETAPDAIVLADSAGTITLANAEMERVFGYKREELLGKSVDMLVPDAQRPAHPGHRSGYLASPRTRRMAAQANLQGRRKDGSLVPVEISLSPVVFNNETHVIGIVRDVTERREQELKIARLSRIQAVLSGINSAIVRIGSRQELLEEACRIAVEFGGFGLAWIGLLDPANLDVTPVAWAGLGSDELKQGKSTARADVPLGQGMVGRAIRNRSPAFSNDISAEQGVGGKRREEAIRLGYRSLIALPLYTEGSVAGILALFAKELNYFTDEEIELLTELAGNISFALEHVARQQKIEKLSRIRAISSEINAAIVRSRNRQQLFYEACRIAVEHGKFGIAWIGELDPVKLEVTPVASTGLEDSSFLMRTILSVRADGPQASGSLPRAVRDRRPIYNNDITVNTEAGGERREEAVRRGYHSVIVLPLVVDGAVAGTFSMFAKEPNYFDDEEVSLLTEVAGNISFALEHLARQGKIEKLSRIRAVSSEINAAIVRVRGRKALLEETCRVASEQGKFDMVWIATIDHDKQEVLPVAWTGFSAETARSVSWASISAAKGTLGEAMRDRKPAVRDDIEIQLPAGKLRQEALAKGCHSTVCLPLVGDDKVTALIALFVAGRGFFDQDELTLLDEVAADVSFALDHIASEEKLDYMAYYDVLTGLPNRKLFSDRVEQRVSEARRDQKTFSVMMLDIERFRHFNETLGRQSGDELLRQVSQRLKNALRDADIPANLGGDHFAVANRFEGEEGEVAHVLEQILTDVCGQPFRVGGEELRLAVRTGVAIYPADGADADSLLRNAEAALGDAKERGHGYQFYTPQMNARVAEQLKLENDLRNATVQEQFVLHYQPRFDLHGGRMTGMEALIRWAHPERGMVSPGEFVPVLEETGMIIEVGRWALRRAALEHAAWSAAGLKPPRIAVNVSPAQLRRKDFVAYMLDALAIVDNAAQRIDIEITEGMLMEDIEGSIEKLKAVQAMGLNVAIDDFGTGYSSLSYLARLPINSLKIDRSFIIQMPKSPEQMAIVSTVISLARALNLKVVAEGVETEEQAKLLRLLRCDEVQGYLFGRPLPPEGLEKLLREKGGTA